MSTERHNPDLDDVMSGRDRLNNEVDKVRRAKGRRRRNPDAFKKDTARRYAFKVLAVLAGLPFPQRKKVLEAAQRLNEA